MFHHTMRQIEQDLDRPSQSHTERLSAHIARLVGYPVGLEALHSLSLEEPSDKCNYRCTLKPGEILAKPMQIKRGELRFAVRGLNCNVVVVIEVEGRKFTAFGHKVDDYIFVGGNPLILGKHIVLDPHVAINSPGNSYVMPGTMPDIYFAIDYIEVSGR